LLEGERKKIFGELKKCYSTGHTRSPGENNGKPKRMKLPKKRGVGKIRGGEQGGAKGRVALVARKKQQFPLWGKTITKRGARFKV